MKNVFFLLLFCLFSPFAFAQMSGKWRAGSARSLSGRTCIISAYVSYPGSDWSEADKTRAYNGLREAQTWLKTQTESYGKQVEFINYSWGWEETIILEALPEYSTEWGKLVLEQFAYSGKQELHEWAKKEVNADNTLLIVFVNDKKVSVALPYGEGVDENYFLEHCVIYNQFHDGQPLIPAAIAHEILHLFGAWDLYSSERSGQAKDRQQYAEYYYPNDIMLRVDYDINKLKIDKLSAWLVGLSPHYEPYFEWYKPAGY